MALVKKGDRYYAVIYQGKGRPRKTIPLGDNQREATRQHSELMVKSAKGLPLPMRCTTPFEDKVREFLEHGTPNLAPSTRAAYASRFENHFTNDLSYGHRPLYQVMTTENIQRWVTREVADEKGATLILACLTALGSFASWCVDTNALAENPVHRVRKPRTPRPTSRYVLEPAQVAMLIRHTPTHHRPLMMFLALTGCRPSEGCALDWSSISFSTAQAHIRKGSWSGKVGDTKTHRQRVLPLSASMLRALEEQKRYSNSEFVFPAASGKMMNMAWFTRSVFVPSLHRAGLVIPEGSRSLYLLRRSLATNLLASGVSIKAVADLLGHDPSVLLNIYAMSRQGEKEAAIAGLDDAVFGSEKNHTSRAFGAAAKGAAS